MKIACVQMDVVFGKPEKNFAVVKQYVEEAAKNGADTIVLPEMWNTGYALTELQQLADDHGEETKKFLSEQAKALHVNIVGGSVATNRNGEYYNTMYAFDRKGELLSQYDKAHLFKLMDEHHYMQAGHGVNLFQLDQIDCGGVICYDLRFPEWIRTHVLQGAKVMFIPAQWPTKRVDHWQVLLQARAIENQCYIIGVNRVGSDPNNEFNGNSMVIAPWGELLLSGEEEAGIYYANIEMEEIDQVRKRIPVFQDRREDLYL